MGSNSDCTRGARVRIAESLPLTFDQFPVRRETCSYRCDMVSNVRFVGCQAGNVFIQLWFGLQRSACRLLKRSVQIFRSKHTKRGLVHSPQFLVLIQFQVILVCHISQKCSSCFLGQFLLRNDFILQMVIFKLITFIHSCVVTGEYLCLCVARFPLLSRISILCLAYLLVHVFCR